MTNPAVGRALDCSRAHDLIDAFLLDELEPSDAVRLAAHVKGCASCAAEIGGSTRVLGLLGALPVPRPTPDLDERILLAAFADRRNRGEHHSWLSDLRSQVIRGAMRTTGTLIVTVMAVALLGGAFVFAASQVVLQFPALVARSTPTPAPTHTLTPATTVPSAIPGTHSAPPPASAAPEPSATPEPSAAPSPTPEPSATPEPSPSASPSPSVEPSASPSPSVEPSPSATAEPTPTPTPTPTPSPSPSDKRRTPPPSGPPSP